MDEDRIRDLLRRVLALLEETEEWIGEGYDERSIDLQAEIEEVLNEE